MCLFPGIRKKWKNFFFSSLYIWFNFHEVENISLMFFISTKRKKTKVIFFKSLYFCFYLQELGNIPRTGKSFNDSYYFYKVKNIWETNCKMHFNEVEEKTSFPYFYTHLILFPKVKNIVPIHFFLAKYKKFDWVF